MKQSKEILEAMNKGKLDTKANGRTTKQPRETKK